MGKYMDIKSKPVVSINDVKEDETDQLIVELFKRGATIERVFGVFYALEAMADARHDEIFGNDEEGLHGAQSDRPRLTVGDALLAGVVARDINTNPIPF